MWNIADIKTKGREAFKANYWPSVLVSAIYFLLQGGNTARSASSFNVNVNGQTLETSGAALSGTAESLTPGQAVAVAGILTGAVLIALVIAALVKAFLVNPVEVGANRFFKNNVNDSTTSFGVLGEGFSDFGRTFMTLLIRDVLVAVGLALFVIPGVYLMYAFRMVPFIVKDNPELSAIEVLKRSNEMMNGNKWQAFLLDLSFIGWYLLGAVTFGLGWFLWANPYHMSTNAALYLELKNQ